MAKYSRYKQTADDIIIAGIKAMIKMAKEYSCREDKWTRGYYAPWLAPEYIYTVAVAKAANPAKRGVYCEYNVKDAVKDGVIKACRGRPNKIPAQSRCDVLITDGRRGIPKLCLEVKTKFGGHTHKDVKKCRKIISGKGENSLRDAAVLFISCAQKKETLRQSFERQRGELEKHERVFSLNGKGRVATSFRNIECHEYEYDKKIWCWYVGAVQMSLTEHQ